MSVFDDGNRLLQQQDHVFDLKESPTNSTIFMNIYINPDRVKKSFQIAQEQLRVVSESRHVNDTIYYNMIGYRNYTEYPVCRGGLERHCHFLRHYDKAFEEVTLQRLYEYCRRYPHQTVTYLHNKGSFRKDRGNCKTRRLVTTAVLSDACLSMPLDPHTYDCNVCSLNFRTTPHIHFSTNMWTAQCRLVRKLVPPREYEAVRTRLFRRVWDQYEESCGLVDWDNATMEFGLSRYSMERWLASHPDMLPCDTINHAMAKFHRGWEKWNPTLYASRSLTRLGYAQDKERLHMWLQYYEFQQLYDNSEPNDIFRNYTSAIDVSSPC